LDNGVKPAADSWGYRGSVVTDMNSRVVSWATSNLNLAVQTVGYWDRAGRTIEAAGFDPLYQSALQSAPAI
jgi:hypothetical protein